MFSHSCVQRSAYSIQIITIRLSSKGPLFLYTLYIIRLENSENSDLKKKLNFENFEYGTWLFLATFFVLFLTVFIP